MKNQLDDEDEFNALHLLGHRYPSQMLDELLEDEFFVFIIMDKDPIKAQWADDNLEPIELLRIFAMRRTDLYLSLEDHDKK